MTIQQENQQVTDKSTLHKGRTELPNILFDLKLDPFAFLLYSYYKKVAGDSGHCIKALDTISNETGISESVIKDRIKVLCSKFKLLGNLPLIKVTYRKKPNGSNDTTLVEIQDIWLLNFIYLDKKYPKKTDEGLGRQKTYPGSPKTYKEDPLEEDLKKAAAQKEEIAAAPLPEEKKEVASLPECLSQFSFTESFQKKLVKKKSQGEYSDQDYERAAAILITKSYDCAAALFLTILKNPEDYKPTKKMDPLKNQELIRKLYSHVDGISFKNGLRIDMGSKGLEFARGSNCEVALYDDRDCIDKALQLTEKHLPKLAREVREKLFPPEKSPPD